VHATPEFSVTRHRAGEAVVVVPAGEIDLATIDELDGQLQAAGAESAQVVLDLREVTFIDSAGLRLVLQSSRELEQAGAALAVVRGSGEVQRIFDLVGLAGRLTMLERPPGA
jgi:anti-sigma B factor antagonist